MLRIPDRRSCVIALLLSLQGLAACAAGSPPPPTRQTVDAATVESKRLPLPETASPRIARLIEAFELRSSDPRFGGFSGMLLTDTWLHLLSDRGWLWSRARGPGADLDPAGAWQVTEVRVEGRRPDAEDLTATPDGRLWMALEGREAIASIAGPDKTSKVTVRSLPSPFTREAGRDGIESLAAGADASLLAISEGQTQGEDCYLTMRLIDHRTEIGCYQAAKGFRPTGAARSSTHLLVLERRVSLLGFESRVVAVPYETGSTLPARLEGIEIARIHRAGLSENYEGIALDPRASAADAVHFWIIADDNFTPLQQTRLLHFRWAPAP